VTRRDRSSHAAAGLTVDAIAEAALAVIRSGGVDGLTMRAVADRLSVRAPSLYHHVHDKSELLDLVARNAFGRFGADNAAYGEVRTVDEWIELTRSGSLDLRTFYAGHPGLAGLIQSKATPGRDRGDGSRAELIRAQIDALVRLGVPEPDARHLFEVSARWTLAAVVAESADQATPVGGPDLFADGLGLFLAGVRARLIELVS
jgi:AcrR family transcriptional regulator